MQKQFLNKSRILLSLTILFIATFYISNSIFYFKKVSIESSINQVSYFEIKEGDSLIQVSKNLKEQNYIKSEFLFKSIFVFKNGKNKKISFGDYNFYNMNIFEIVNKLGTGKADQSGISITVPEGFTNEQIAYRLESLLGISAKDFIKESESHRGKLFPETYIFKKDVSIKEVILRMELEFKNRVGEISSQDIVLASIIEGEAKTKEAMGMVAGILKKRMSIGMPLQVDVALETYKNNEIPKVAINNPGLNAINAIRNPIKSEFLYYITGNDGEMYYAKTFEKHKENIAKYLKM